MNKKLKFLFGFTLAEVLVTLGIIGVISAMTVPTLFQNYQKKSYVTQLHKVYNEVQQAAVAYMNDKNAINLREAGFNNSNAVSDFVKFYFKIIQDCGANAVPCFADSYKKLSGVSTPVGGAERYFVLSSGASVATIARDNAYGDLVAEIWVDTNGKQGPNIVGRDFFIMYLYKNVIIDDINFEESSSDSGYNLTSVPLSKEYRENLFTKYCKGGGEHRRGCFGKILNDNWEMTY